MRWDSKLIADNVGCFVKFSCFCKSLTWRRERELKRSNCDLVVWFLPISCQSRTSSQVQSLSAFVLVLLCFALVCLCACVLLLRCLSFCACLCLCCLFPSPAKATPLLKSRGCFNVKSLCALPVFVCVLPCLVHDLVCSACLPPFRFPVCLPSDCSQHLPVELMSTNGKENTGTKHFQGRLSRKCILLDLHN